MERKIPIYFDTIILDSPAQEISLNGYSEDVGNRLQVAVFTKYKNRNGSYITDEYADLLIESATRGDTPVVGFFDPESQSWASHTGPTLANGYGYVEDFLGWKPLKDTDGIEREYAVFSVVIFTKYYEEAKKIYGQNQSMELNPETIDGKWIELDGEEYFAYTQGDMLGLCVIGSHEPCFSVSTFFSKNDETYKTQYQKFSALLADLKDRVENLEKGGEQPMNEFANQEPENIEPETPVVETPQEEPVAPETFEENSQNEGSEEPVADSESPAEAPVVEEATEPSEFDLLQNQFNDLQASYNQLQADYTNAQERITELEQFQATANTELENLRAQNTQLQTSLTSYEAAAAAAEEERKNALIAKYEKIIKNSEEIIRIKELVKDFSYDELEGKLAIMFANQQMASSEETDKVPLLEPAESQFALLMKKYRKN